MTPEEFETQFEKTNRQIEKTNRQAEETNKRLEILSETQTEFTQVVTRHIEAQGEFISSIHNAVRDLSATVERYISEGRNGKA
jgi:vacuolar-type H+-ATPase subunit I/STV1